MNRKVVNQEIANPIKLNVLVLAKMEKGEMSEDTIGEAQLTYDRFIKGDDEIVYELANKCKLYLNAKTNVGIVVTGSGKTAVSSAMATILSDLRFNFEEALIISIGCSGASYEASTIGDISICAEAVDGDLGHTAGYNDYDNPEERKSFWYHDASFDNNSYLAMNQELVNRVYELIKDVPLRTTKMTQSILVKNFPEQEWALRDPKVLIGTHVTSDIFWKGLGYHNQIESIVETYECKNPYTACEMEDIATAVVARDFDILDRLVILRAQVNVDVFLKGQTPDSLWGSGYFFTYSVYDVNEETLDAFEPVMYSLADVTSVIIEAVLNNTF